MDKEPTTIEAKDQTIVTDPAGSETSTTPAVENELEAKLSQIEAEKNKALEEAANYKIAYLKEKRKAREEVTYDDDPEETEQEKISRLVKEEVARQKVAQLDQEKENLLKQALKENKELKLANLNKTVQTPPAGIGGHSEGTSVRDTLVTPDQMAAFKSRGWSDKDIERYKKNLRRYSL